MQTQKGEIWAQNKNGKCSHKNVLFFWCQDDLNPAILNEGSNGKKQEKVFCLFSKKEKKENFLIISTYD